MTFTYFNMEKKAMKYIKDEIEKEYNEDFDLDKYINELTDNLVDFEFDKPIEVMYALKRIETYIDDKFEHIYDIHIIETMYIYVIAQENKDILEKYVEELNATPN